MSIFEVIKEGNVSELTRLLEQGEDCNKVEENSKNTLLIIATGEGRVDCIEVLLKAGADVNKKRFDG